MYLKREAEKNLEKLLKTPKILIILGARQVGKTTLIKHFLRDKKVVFLNFDIEADKERFTIVSRLPPEKVLSFLDNPDFIVIDEAQKMVKTRQVAKGWFDSNIKAKILLLGSSSLDLLNQSAESLTGRNQKIFLSPLTFKEIVYSQSWYSNILSDKQIQDGLSGQVNALLLQTMVFGSYPELVFVDDKSDFLNNLVSDYLLKDILQLGLVKNPEIIKKLLSLLAYQIGSEVSISELSVALGLSRQTVERYLDLLEQTFVIFRLPAFGKNPRREIIKNKKIYFWDTGIRNALLGDFSVSLSRSDLGQLWENWVIVEFAKKNLLDNRKKNLFFWRSQGKSEVDLIVKENEKLSAFEIKWKKKNVKKKAFEEAYKTKVRLIDSSNPLLVFE
jgi:predicted AAA+ superfamily ATPase